MAKRETAERKSGPTGGRAGGDDRPARKPRAGVVPLEQLNQEMQEHDVEAREIVADLTPRDLTARLFRSHPALPGGEAFVDEFPARLADQAYIARTYGGGSYRVEIYGLTNKGRDRPARGKLRQETFTVDLTIPPKNPGEELGPAVRSTTNGARPPDPEPARQEPAPPPIIAPADAINAALQGSVISMFRTMQELGHLQTSMVERLVTKQPERPAVDWGEVAKVAVPAAVTLLTALLAKKDTSVSQAKELMTLLQSANPQQPRRSAVEELRDAMALMQELRSEAPEGGSAAAPNAVPWWADLAKAGAQIVAGMADSRGEPPALAPGAPVPSLAAGSPPAADPPGVAAAAPQPAAETAVIDADPMLAQLRPFAPHLAQWAREARSPEWAAETLLFEIPPGFHAYLLPRLRDPAMIPQLVRALPVLVPYEPWLQSVRAALVEQLDQGDGDGSQPNDQE